MNFALYRQLLAIRPIRRLLLVGMIARIPHSAAGVLLTLHIVLTLGQGYAAAGAAAAVMTIGIAVGAPWRGRRVDTVGPAEGADPFRRLRDRDLVDRAARVLRSACCRWSSSAAC